MAGVRTIATGLAASLQQVSSRRQGHERVGELCALRSERPEPMQPGTAIRAAKLAAWTREAVQPRFTTS
jgi:hypothetical protein